VSVHELGELIPYLIPIVVVQVGLQVWALVDLVRRPRVVGLPKAAWAVVILLGQMLGPVVYLLVGRADA
jgi:hypothetical protein